MRLLPLKHWSEFYFAQASPFDPLLRTISLELPCRSSANQHECLQMASSATPVILQNVMMFWEITSVPERSHMCESLTQLALLPFSSSIGEETAPMPAYQTLYLKPFINAKFLPKRVLCPVSQKTAPLAKSKSKPAAVWPAPHPCLLGHR